ncbi:MAG: cbb3-type cytochrome c oxidase subunit 3 [Ignavibacteria bacterium]|nr:cbb3-type cytochrome c oxidase subunit 3 [Ignavibacteria bacterium]
MFSKYLTSIEGIAIYPIIVLLLFFILFLFVIIKTIRMDKKHIIHMANLPLDSKSEKTNNPEIKNENQ